MAKFSAYGAQFQIGSTSVIGSATYTTVAQVTNIDPPEQETDMIQVSTHDDSTRYHTYVAGRIEGGEVTIEGFLDPSAATHMNGAGSLFTLRNTGEVRAFKIIYPDTGAAELAFQGIVKNFKPGPLPQDGAIEFSAVIKVTGAETFTA